MNEEQLDFSEINNIWQHLTPRKHGGGYLLTTEEKCHYCGTAETEDSQFCSDECKWRLAAKRHKEFLKTPQPTERD